MKLPVFRNERERFSLDLIGRQPLARDHGVFAGVNE
jgi:hypothetical protein